MKRAPELLVYPLNYYYIYELDNLKLCFILKKKEKDKLQNYIIIDFLWMLNKRIFYSRQTIQNSI